MTPSCDTCAHWRRLSNYRGQCLKSPYYATAYKQVGAIDTDTFEETKPSYWCIDFDLTQTP